MQNQAFYRTGIFGNFFFGGGGEFCVFKTGIPGGPAMDLLITIKFGRLKQNIMPRTKHRSKSKSEVKFQYGGRLFPKPEIVVSQPWIEISHRNLVCK